MHFHSLTVLSHEVLNLLRMANNSPQALLQRKIKLPELAFWNSCLRSHNPHAQVLSSGGNVNDLEADPTLTLAPGLGQQALLPQVGQDGLLLLLGLLVAREDPGAGAPCDHKQLRELRRLEVLDNLLHQALRTVLGDDVRIIVLVLVVPAENRFRGESSTKLDGHQPVPTIKTVGGDRSRPGLVLLHLHLRLPPPAVETLAKVRRWDRVKKSMHWGSTFQTLPNVAWS